MIKETGSFIPRILKGAIAEHKKPLPFINPRYGTILFSDVSGFTSLTEKLMQTGREGSEELTSIVNRYFDQMINIIYSSGGDIIKFGGDALLSVFDEPDSMTTALRAVKNMMNAAKKEYKTIVTSAGTFAIRMHCGLDQGEFWECAAGNEKKQMEYLVFGVPVARALMAADAVSYNEAGLFQEHLESLSLFSGMQFVHEKNIIRIKNFRYKPVTKTVTAPVLESEIPDRNIELFIPEPLRPFTSSSAHIGEHRKVCVCFIELMSAFELRKRILKAVHDRQQAHAYFLKILSEVFDAIIKNVETYEGTYLKTDNSVRGEKIILLFGAPNAHEDDDVRAVEALRQIVAAVQEIQLRFRKELKIPEDLFRIRCGVTSGNIFWTLVGNKLRKEWTVMGDSVNLAARFMSIAQPWSVTTERAFAQKLHGYEWEFLGHQALKGKQKAIDIFKLVHKKILSEAAPRSQKTIIGRHNEMALLEQAVEEIKTAAARLVSINGDAGIGKTMLCNYVMQISCEREFPCYLITCQPYEKGQPYYIWKKFFYLFFDAEGIDITRIHEVAWFLQKYFFEQKKWLPVLNDIFLCGIKENEWTKFLDGKKRKERLMELIANLLNKISKKIPLTIIFDDTHWVDTVSLELIAFLFRKPAIQNILILLSHRDSQNLQSLKTLPLYSEIALKELTEIDSGHLVRNILGEEEPSDKIANLIHQKTCGNPLFTTLLAESLSQHKDIRLGDAVLPDTITSMFLSILDTFSSEEKLFLKLASIIGKSFKASDITTIFKDEIRSYDVNRIINKLTQLDWLFLEKRDQYSFRYPLMQEVAYESTSYIFKRHCHKKIADYYERITKNLNSMIEFLAFHYYRSTQIRKAISYTLRAARKSFSLYILPQSNAYFHEVLHIINKITQKRLPGYLYEFLPPASMLKKHEFDALGGWSDVLSDMGKVKQAIEQYQKAIHKGCKFVKTKDILLLQQKIAYNHFIIGNLHQAFTIATKTFLKAKFLSSSRAMAYSMGIMANIKHRQKEFQKGLLYAKNAMKYAQNTHNDRLLADSYSNLSIMYSSLNEIPKSIEYTNKALAIRMKIKDKFSMTICFNNLGVFYHLQKKYSRAIYYYHKAFEMCKNLDDQYGVAYSRRNLGELFFEQGKLDESLNHFLKAHEYALQSGDKILERATHLFLAALFARKHDYDKCMQHLQPGVAYARDMLLNEELLVAYYWVMHFLATTNRHDEARLYYNKIIALLRKMDPTQFYYALYLPRLHALKK